MDRPGQAVRPNSLRIAHRRMTDHELRTALMTQLQIADSYLLAGNHAYGGKLRAETLRALNVLKDGPLVTDQVRGRPGAG